MLKICFIILKCIIYVYLFFIFYSMIKEQFCLSDEVDGL